MPTWSVASGPATAAPSTTSTTGSVGPPSRWPAASSDDDGLAEDVLQDVFLSVWRDPGAYDRGRGSFASWLLAVVHHKAVDAVRREESQRRRQHRAEEELELDAPTATRDVEDEAWNRVVAEQVRTALGGLSDPQREALTLAYYGGYTQREVAALTGAPLGTVKTRMLAGMRRLREELGGPGGKSTGGALGEPGGRGRRSGPMSGRRSGASPSEEHRVFDELAVGWALHALEPEDEAVFAEHLPGCERCAQTVDDTTEVMASMAADLPRTEPSDQLRERLRAAVAETEQIPPDDVAPQPVRPTATGFPGYRAVEAPSAPVPLRRRAPMLALAAAAVATILGLGVWNVFLADSRSDLEATVAQQDRIVDSLLTPGDAKVAALLGRRRAARRHGGRP